MQEVGTRATGWRRSKPGEGGGTEGGKSIKTAMCRGMVTREGERKTTKEAARRRWKGSDGGEDEKWKEREWERQKEARVIGRRGRTSKGEHLPRTRSRGPGGGPSPRSCRRCFPVDQKRSCGKRNARGGGHRRTKREDEDNEHLCMHIPRWDKFHGIGPIGLWRRTRRERFESDDAPPPSRCSRRCGDHCPFFARRFDFFLCRPRMYSAKFGFMSWRAVACLYMRAWLLFLKYLN